MSVLPVAFSPAMTDSMLLYSFCSVVWYCRDLGLHVGDLLVERLDLGVEITLRCGDGAAHASVAALTAVLDPLRDARAVGERAEIAECRPGDVQRQAARRRVSSNGIISCWPLPVAADPVDRSGNVGAGERREVRTVPRDVELRVVAVADRVDLDAGAVGRRAEREPGVGERGVEAVIDVGLACRSALIP